MPMRPEVKAAWIGFAAVIIAAVLTWYLTDLSSQREKERLKARVPAITDPAGIYLWQVSADAYGDPWSGYIRVDHHGVPDVQMSRLEQCNGKTVSLPLLKQEGGEVTIGEPGRLHIHIPVQFIRYKDKCKPTPKGQNPELEPEETLDGDIDQTIGYEGDVRYIKPGGEKPFGGILLIKSLHGSPPQ
jgi:hypothetical protein